jgi:HEAT repeat protein
MKKTCLFMILGGVLLLNGCEMMTAARPTAEEPTVHPTTLRPRAMEILRASLKHSNPYIRNNAIETAVETKQKELMAEIVRLMGDSAVAVRFSAVTGAGDMLCFGCEQDVRKRLTDLDENVRVAAAYSLMKLNYPEFHSQLRAAVESDDQTVRANAVLLLGKAGNRDDLDLLYKVMRSESSDELVKIQAVDSIARLKDVRLYRSKLWALLISKYADDRVMGIRGMGALGTLEAKNAVITMLADDVTEVRLCAAEQLGRLGDRSGREEVAKFLGKSPDLNQPDVATLLSVMAIGRIGTPELAAYLPKAMESRSEMVRLTAAQSVLLLTR